MWQLGLLAREALLAFPLEADHEGDVGPVDGRRHDPQARDLRDRPHAVLAVAVPDGPVLSACSGSRHQSLGIAILEPELRAPRDAETRAGLEVVKLVCPSDASILRSGAPFSPNSGTPLSG